MKNCLTKNFTNKIETYSDFNQKYKSLIERERERERLLVSLIERERATKNFTNKIETYLDFNQKYKSLIKRERERDILNRPVQFYLKDRFST
jgi:uncharacterized protein YeaO (DUF488 family)